MTQRQSIWEIAQIYGSRLKYLKNGFTMLEMAFELTNGLTMWELTYVCGNGLII